MNLRQVDLNLLHIFDAVLQTRNVGAAAERLGLSASAVSHALKRLRHALKDELFLRDETGMQPTPRALELAAPIHDGLALLARALATAPFVPRDSIRTFRIAAGDYACALILPPLVRRLAEKAPQVDLKITPVNRLDVGRQLETGSVDFVVGWFSDLPPELRRKPLMRESGAFVVRDGHPLAAGEVAQEGIFEFPHIVVALTGAEDPQAGGFIEDRGLVRRAWMERAVLQAWEHGDLSARVAISVPHFSAVAPLLRASDMIAMLPLRLARQAVAQGGLVMLDQSLETGSIEIEAAWHSRGDSDQGVTWLLNEVAEACGALAADHSGTVFG
jgi:DNA-binding transcriptional LysR family regulator